MATAKKTRPAHASAATFERHRRKCTVCDHPERETIENYFIHWFRPGWIATHFELSEDSLFRHVSAAGLYEVRAGLVRSALERIIERVNQAPVTAASIVDAVRAYTHIDDRGRWAEPPTTHVVVPGSLAATADLLPGGSARAQNSTPAPALPAAPESSKDPQSSNGEPVISNRGSGELENAATR